MNNSNHRPDVFLVIAALAFVAIIGVIGMMALIYRGVDPNKLAPVSPIIATAVGALAGILATTGPRQAQGTPTDPVATQVVNTATDPVETHPNPTEAAPSYPADNGGVSHRMGAGLTAGESIPTAAPPQV